MGRAGTPFRPSSRARASLSLLRLTFSTEWREMPADVASFLKQRTTGPVVLVGHSYGGVVITNAGTAGGDVKALVYVDAFIPEVGETVFQILGGSGSALDVPDPTAVLDIVGYPGAPEGDAEAFLKPSNCPRCLRAGSSRGRPVADRREPASDHARCEHSGDRDDCLEDHTELGRGRNRGPRHPPGHAAQDGGAGGLDDHRGSGIARINGVPSGGCDRGHPRRRRSHRRLAWGEASRTTRHEGYGFKEGDDHPRRGAARTAVTWSRLGGLLLA